ncbi:MAG: hypothetical protein ACD_2C00219G0001 [uncultured bacterium (gcode 4)]|uniref:Uncharacterized protein n=1 Tax=uncultured bacterium (gcode 4) TaxID=1234023 RepID=K2GFT1_9BACT|nr:MAG: hypothetical protein ACD_2C00219G0001 [uncultured bacterium (gcode 4)]
MKMCFSSLENQFLSESLNENPSLQTCFFNELSLNSFSTDLKSCSKNPNHNSTMNSILAPIWGISSFVYS